MSSSEDWIEQFRQAVERYYERPHDPFMEWFAQKRRENAFANHDREVATILTDARFDQAGILAEKALENTISVYELLSADLVSVSQVPLLTAPPNSEMGNESWTRAFVAAFPAIRATATEIVKTHDWAATDLQERIDAIPWMGVKTSRLAVRWIHELVPDAVEVDMSDSRVPVDRNLYRVASRLGIVDPSHHIYSGEASPGDARIQQFARLAFPRYPVRIDEPMWKMARRPQDGGHCHPKNPRCEGCLFQSFCPKMHRSSDPSATGIRL